MKNIFRKTYKSVLVIGISVFFVLNMFYPVFKVNADNKFGTGANCITTDVTVQAGQEELFDIKSVSVDGNPITDGYQYCVSGDSHTFIITVTKKGDSIPEIGWGGNWNSNAAVSNTSNVGNDYTFTVNVVTPDNANNYYVNLWAKAKPAQQNPNPGNPDPGEPVGPNNWVEFSGKAWFYWNCNNKVCRYLADVPDYAIDGTHGINEDNPYRINYIAESTIVDAKTGTHLEIDNIGEGDYYWTFETDEFIERLESKGIFSEQQINEISGMYEGINTAYNAGTLTWANLASFVDDLEDIHDDAKRAFALDPCGSRDGNNSLSTNGDRNFRATIFDDTKYMGIVFGVSRADYDYFLPGWDPLFFSSEFDISGTTKEDPAIYDVYLLENNLKFDLSTRNVSDIASIKPININKNAVTIKEENGKYTVTFKSNYYNEVEFEVTDVNGKKYYFQLNRIVLNARDEISDNGPILNVEFLYPDTDDISNYELYATYVYKDGTSKVEKIDNNGIYRDANMDGVPVFQKTWNADKGLKGAGYTIKIDKDLKDIYANVVLKGAFDKKAYGGTFAGSGLGLKYDSNRISHIIEDYYNRGGNE